MTKRHPITLAVVLLVGGCQQPRTQHYFEEHDADRANVIDACSKSDRQYQPQDECANALRAQRAANIKQDAGKL